MSENASINQHVFISYARADGDNKSKEIYEALYQERFLAWRDQRNIKPYQDFSVAIERAIRQSSHVLVCLTPSIVQRDDSFVRREIIFAQNQKRPIIPLLFDGFPAKDIPVLISHLTYINFAKFGEGFRSLLEHLRRKDIDYDPPVLPDDPFRHHVEQLNDYMIRELEQMVSHSKIIMLHSEDQSGAIERIIPAAYRTQNMHFFRHAEQRQHFDNFPLAFAQYDQRMLLLGEPGSGKTTTLYAFAREKANERLANVNALLPIYAPIRTWNGSQPLVEWISNSSGLNSTKIQAEIGSGRALLLLDGLDELASDTNSTTDEYDWRAKFIRQLTEFGTTPLLITCRAKDYDEIIVSSGERAKLNGAAILKPLSPEQVRAYLDDYPELLNALQSDKDLFEMARNPLLLTLLTVAFQGETAAKDLLSNLNSSRAEWRDAIFRTYVQRRYEFEEFRNNHLPFSLNEMYEVLGQAATNLVSNGKQTNHNELNVQLFEDLLTSRAQSFVEFSQRLHYLINTNPQVFRFIHLLLRDHFAIHHLLPRARSNNQVVRQTAQRILRLLNAVTTNVFISYSRDNRQQVQTIRDILKRNGISSSSDENIVPGTSDWESEIRQAIDRSDYVIVLINRSTLQSRYVEDEINLALNQNKTIIPILLDKGELPPALKNLQYVRISSSQKDERQLEQQLITLIAGDDISDSGRQVYLRNIRRRYERFSSSSFGLSVRMKPSGSEHSSVAVLIPQTLERNYPQPWRLILVGQGGSGKTTALQRLLIDFTRRALQDPFALIPVLVNAREFSLEDTTDFDRVIDQSVNQQKLGKYSFGQLLILIDGIDELGQEHRNLLAEWIDQHLDTSILLSSRYQIGQAFALVSARKFETIELLPPTENDIRSIVFQRFTPNEAEKFWQWLNSNAQLLEFSHSPLTLTLLLSNYSSSQRLPDANMDNLDELIQSFVHQSSMRVENIAPQKQLLSFLRLLAREIEKGPGHSIMRDRAASLFELMTPSEQLSFENLMRAATQSGIIREVTNGDFAFVHKSFLEYFAQD